MGTEAFEAPSLRIGRSSYPLVGPRLSDPRLQVAGVIFTLHVLGQVTLDFRVSVIHIAASIATCLAIELAYTFGRDRKIVWPASAMLTGSGIALILRLPDAEANDPWATEGWQVFVAVSALALCTKYVIRFRGSHVFNPSNVALVATFVVLGSSRAEPLDFWWGPMGPAMAVAYGVIIVGGVAITRRLELAQIVGGFWVTLAIGLGALALSGHCIHAPWDLHPVCDGHFWWVVVTSPETLVFMFFMITDPRTIPATASGRLWFGVLVASMSTLLMAPQSTEFGAKVGLLAGLAVCSTLRPLVILGSERLRAEELGRWHPPAGRLASWPRSAVVVPVVLATALMAMVAGGPARSMDELDDAAPTDVADPTGVLPPVDLAAVPTLSIEPAVLEFDESLSGTGALQLAADFLWLLAVEELAVARRDEALVRGVTQGRRRDQSLERIDVETETGVPIRTTYEFETLRLVLVRAGQARVRLGFEATGSRIDVVQGSDLPATRSVVDVDETFVLFGPSSGRWYLFDTLPIDAG